MLALNPDSIQTWTPPSDNPPVGFPPWQGLPAKIFICCSCTQPDLNNPVWSCVDSSGMPANYGTTQTEDIKICLDTSTGPQCFTGVGTILFDGTIIICLPPTTPSLCSLYPPGGGTIQIHVGDTGPGGDGQRFGGQSHIVSTNQSGGD